MYKLEGRAKFANVRFFRSLRVSLVLQEQSDEKSRQLFVASLRISHNPIQIADYTKVKHTNEIINKNM